MSEVAKNILFVVVCSALLGVIAVAASTFASVETPADPCPPGCCPAVVAPAEDELCGRYHLRKRTNRFFRRSVV